MRILLLTPKFPLPPSDGIRVKTYNTIKELAKSNTVSLLVVAEKSDMPSQDEIKELKDYCKDISIIVKPPHPGLLRRIANDLFTRCPSYVREYRSEAVAIVLEEKLQKFDPDVVYFDTINLTSYVEVVKGRAAAVASPNDCLTLALVDEIVRSPMGIGSFPKRCWRVVQATRARSYEKSFYPRFEKVVVVSRVDEDYMRRINPLIDVETVPNGVDINFFSPQREDPEDASIVFFGDMGGGNSDYLAWFIRKALPKIKRNRPDIKLYVLGKNPKKSLVNLAEKTPGVLVEGYVDDLRPFLSKCAVAISPVFKRCGMLTKVIVAMAMGLAVVGTPEGFSAIEGAVDGEHLVYAASAAEFAEKILFLLEHKEEAKRIGENARVLVAERYCWEETGKKIEDVLRRASDKGAASRSDKPTEIGT